MRTLTATLAAVAAAVLLIGCSSAAAPAPAGAPAQPAATSAPAAPASTASAAAPAKAAEFTMRLGDSTASDHPYNLGAKRLAELVGQRSNGRVKIDIFDNSQLGAEKDLVEGLQNGTMDLVVTSTGPLGGFVPEINVVDLPFLFRDKAHAYKVLDGQIGQDLLKKFDPVGIKGLSVWENGFRNITNSKRPITSPADLKGLKIRTMENKVHMTAFQALGANPTPMAFNEVYLALQTGALDAQENPLPVIYTSKLYEVQKYLSLTGHFYSPAPLLMSGKTWQKLPADLQKVFADTSVEVATYERQQIQTQEDQQVSQLKEKGMQVSTPDKKPFQDATQSVYQQFEGQFGKDLIQSIVNTK